MVLSTSMICAFSPITGYAIAGNRKLDTRLVPKSAQIGFSVDLEVFSDDNVVKMVAMGDFVSISREFYYGSS